VTTLNLYETIQRIVQEELRYLYTSELGVVQEQHPHASDSDQDNYACTVQLRNSGIVLKQVPVATSRVGTVLLPAVGDLVVVQFIGGDINAPVVVGSVYNDEQRPPVNTDGQAILHLPLGSEDSDAVHIELSSGDKRECLIKLGSGLSLSLRDDDPSVEIDVDDGQAKINIARDGTISITSKSDISIKGDGKINIEAAGDLTLKGAKVNIN
jgi:phage baseplate assembly protein gpV